MQRAFLCQAKPLHQLWFSSVAQDVEQTASQRGCGASPARVSHVESHHIRSGIPPRPAVCQAGSSAVELSSPTKILACSLSVISMEAALGAFALLAFNPGSRQ